MKTVSIQDLDHKRLKRLSADMEMSIKDVVSEAIDAFKEKVLLNDNRVM